MKNGGHIILVNKWGYDRELTYKKCPYNKKHVIGLGFENPIYVGNMYCARCRHYVSPSRLQAVCRDILWLFKIGIVWCSNSQGK